MSGFSYPQPVFSSDIYNPAFYLSLGPNGFLSFAYAQTLYLSKYDYRLSYISGITPGIATAGVALILGNDLSLSGVGALSCSSLSIGGASLNLSDLTYLNGTSPGTVTANKALIAASDTGVGCGSLRINGVSETFAGGGGAGNITRSNMLWRHTGGRVVLCNWDTSIDAAGALNFEWGSGGGSTPRLWLSHTYGDFLSTLMPSLRINIDPVATATNFNLHVNGSAYLSSRLSIGSTSTDANKPIIALKSDMASGDYVSSWLGRDLTSRNGCYLKYYYAGNNSASSYMSFGFHSQDDRLVITPSNYVGIGTTSPSYGLEVVSYGAFSIGSGVMYGWYGPGGSGQNQLGPINVQISILATQGVMTLNNYYARSDRRCKKRIRPIDSEYAASFVRNVAPPSIG